MRSIIVLLGGPGAGKGTQARALADLLAIPHISTGELLRSEAAQQSNLGLSVKTIMEEGRLVSDDVVSSLLRQRITESECSYGFILDGFPRNVCQVVTFQEMLSGCDRPIAIDIAVDLEQIVGRLAQRGRFDDREEVIRERFKVYERQTAPVTELYRNWHFYWQVDGMQPVEHVTQDLLDLVGTRVVEQSCACRGAACTRG